MNKIYLATGLVLMSYVVLFSKDTAFSLHLDSIPQVEAPTGMWINYGMWKHPVPRHDDDYYYNTYLDLYHFSNDSSITRYKHNLACPKTTQLIYHKSDTILQIQYFNENGDFIRWKKWGIEYKDEELVAFHENPESPRRSLYMYRKLQTSRLVNPKADVLLEALRHNTFYHRGEEVLLDNWEKRSSLYFLNDSVLIQTYPYEDYTKRDWGSSGSDFQDMKSPSFRTLRYVIDSNAVTGELFLLIVAHKPIQVSYSSSDTIRGNVYAEQFDTIQLIKANYNRNFIDFFGTWSMDKPIDLTRCHADCLDGRGTIQFLRDSVLVTPREGTTLTYKCTYLNNALLHLELSEVNTEVADEFWGTNMYIFQTFKEDQRMGIYVRKQYNERRGPNQSFLFLKK